MKKICLPNESVALVTDRLIRKYLTSVDIADGVLVVGDKSAYFTDARYFYAAKKTLEKVGIDAKLYTGLDCVFDFIKESNAKSVMVDYLTTTVKEYNDYLKYGLEVKDLSNILIELRSIKSEEEIALIKKACEIAQNAYRAAIKEVKEGITELQLKSVIERKIIEFGGDGASFDIIVAFGENSAVPHHETGETVLKKDSVILVDMGALVKGYMSDLTRTAFFGTPDKKFVDCYKAVKEANELAEEKIVEGTKACDADAIARDYLRSKNLDTYFTHSLGHGVGIEIHEYPTLSKRCDAVLKENTVFTVEPGVYFDGEFGIRIEDTVVIKNKKVQRLITDDKELLIIKN
ncbi:MAG: aminopeptidase P family protein [Clostridia bacterium]|nr:aminopeptidase P family protein [Clostridia bacterium]